MQNGLESSKVFHRTLRTRPDVAVEGQGLYMTLSNGKTVLDASGGAAVACIGHGNARVARAIGDQAKKFAYAHTMFFSTEPAEELAQLLVGDAPGGLTRAYLVSSGSEAMESAIKLARQYFVEIGQPERTRFIARRQSYHGNTFGALSLSGHQARRKLYEPMLMDGFSHVSPCFAHHYRADGETDAQYVARLAAELDAEFRRLGPNTVAAFAAEPIVGATSGCVTAVPGYFVAIKEVCDRYGALLIFDEIMSGMGRSGAQHVWQQEGVTPDIQAVAKGLGGGYVPIGALLVSQRVVSGLEGGSGNFSHGHTYQAHAVSCAGALEVQRIIREHDLIGRVGRMAPMLENALRDRFGANPHIGDIRGRGFFWALEFTREGRRPIDPAVQFSERLKRTALGLGLAIYPNGGTIDGVRGDHVIVAPPFNVTEDEIAKIIDLLGKAVDTTLADLPAEALRSSSMPV